MKVFDLVCSEGHRFEGWFASAEQFASQSEAHAVHCPVCESGDVHREPSAPRLNLTGDTGATPTASRSRMGNGPSDASSAAEVLGGLRRLVAQTEDVGPRFAEEARRIHYDETPARPIRGTATDRERRDLKNEGIETLTIPMPRAITETLQ